MVRSDFKHCIAAAGARVESDSGKAEISLNFAVLAHGPSTYTPAAKYETKCGAVALTRLGDGGV